MSFYRKKPVVVEAVQYEGKGNLKGHGAPEWFWAALESGVAKFTDGLDPLTLQTLEGVMRVDAGDWIIRGIKG